MQYNNIDSNGFDFDEWVELAKEDPAAFEARRDALLREAIDQAPLHFRKKLQGLQFQVDMIRERSAHPMGACVRIGSLMMDSLFAIKWGCSGNAITSQGNPSRSDTGKSNLIAFPSGSAGRRPL